MRTSNFKYLIGLLLFIALPFSVFAQYDSIYIHSKGKVVFKESLSKIDSITFTAPDVPPVDPPVKENKVLLLKVDYTTNMFESAAELSFDSPLDTLTLAKKYVSPGDFGSIEFYYPEINEVLFRGDIVWMGTGQITYPGNWLDADSFAKTDTEDYVYPKNGFENIFNVYGGDDNYSQAWGTIQYVLKVREYLGSNREQKVKYFLYTPSVGAVDLVKAKWIFFLYN